jgi:hypothetical protein
VNRIGGLLKQVIMAQPNVPDDIMQVFRKSKRTALGLEDARHMLSEGLKSFHRTYLCIDALDECKDEYRRVFLRSLQQVSKNSQHLARLFVTSRPYVEDEVGRYFESPLAVRIVANNHDIMKYVAYQIAEDHNPVDMNDDFKNEIITKIADASQGMYVREDSSMTAM